MVATPGAEPVADGGYAAVLLLDTWLLLAAPDLRAGEEALRRWLDAAALARSGAAGGRVVVVGDPAHPALQALVRWDPAGFAGRELAERPSAHLPPASPAGHAHRRARGRSTTRSTLLDAARRRRGARPGAGRPTAERVAGAACVRVPRARGRGAVRARCGEMQGVRSARKLPPVRVQVDPVGLE